MGFKPLEAVSKLLMWVPVILWEPSLFSLFLSQHHNSRETGILHQQVCWTLPWQMVHGQGNTRAPQAALSAAGTHSPVALTAWCSPSQWELSLDEGGASHHDPLMPCFRGAALGTHMIHIWTGIVIKAQFWISRDLLNHIYNTSFVGIKSNNHRASGKRSGSGPRNLLKTL